MVRRIAGLIACGVVIAVAAPRPAHAQFGKLKNKIKERVEKKVDDKVDCTLDKYFDSIECKEAREKASGSNGSGAAGGTAAAPSSGKAESMKPGQGAWANYDFVPGDKILFAEDFTVDRVGNFPKRLELDEGNFEVVEWSGRRWLRADADGQFTITLPQTLPERWTMEMELTIPWSRMLIGTTEKLHDQYNSVQHIELSGTNIAVNNGSKGSEVDPRKLFENMYPENQSLSAPMHVRIQADGAYMKVYLEEHRVANMPNMGRWTGNKLRFWVPENTWNGNPGLPLIANISINAGGKEMYDKLMADGRLAVQGIYFDVGSDRIRPESSGTLSEISDMLKEHADLKLTVEGHTDNVGASDKNKTLSDARAAAVVKYLAGMGIDAARLKSIGYGDAKPAAPNDTPENRQKNRRVELVKM